MRGSESINQITTKNKMYCTTKLFGYCSSSKGIYLSSPPSEEAAAGECMKLLEWDKETGRSSIWVDSLSHERRRLLQFLLVRRTT